MLQIMAALLLASGAAAAQSPPMTMRSGPSSGDTPATSAYKQAMAAMMAGMNVPYSRDADRDFVTGMLPHHQGAIDMAKVERQYGHDPALRRLARQIIASQAQEQAFMRRWLAQHPGP